MITRIDLFLPPFSHYSILHHFTYKLYEALTRLGVHCRILKPTPEDPKLFLQQIFHDTPDCTLSFNGLLPDEHGYFFADAMQIPHVACLTEHPTRFMGLAKSPYTIITCMDGSGLDFFHELGAEHVFFMPHGVEKNIRKDPSGERQIDLLLLSTCFDYEQIGEIWREKYPLPLQEVLYETVEKILREENTTHIQAFIELLNRRKKERDDIDLTSIPYPETLIELDEYIRGKDRVNLIRAIKNHPIDIYGMGPWEKYIKNTKAKVHSPLNFKDALPLMQNSKIVLNSCPTVKFGTHTRTLAGMLSGAVAITPETPYMKEFFKDNTDLLYYRYNTIEEINSQIDDLLANDSKRKNIAKRGMEITAENHTWDHRAAALLKYLGTVLPIKK